MELGKYLCEVRAGQYWRLENLKSFDEFLERRFPESRRKAYYLMSIHEHLPPQVRKELKQVGWTKGVELAKLARRQGQSFEKCNLAAQSPTDAQGGVPAGSGEGTDGQAQRAVGADLFQGLQEPDPGLRDPVAARSSHISLRPVPIADSSRGTLEFGRLASRCGLFSGGSPRNRDATGSEQEES